MLPFVVYHAIIYQIGLYHISLSIILTLVQLKGTINKTRLKK